mgnify:CR=1 FL=1
MELPKRYDPKEAEPRLQQFWEENKTYAFNAEDTERKIMEKIYNIGKKLTIIIITHKMNSIARCNKIYTFNDGRLSQFK